jgi:cell division septum initiation protein DivIVA
MTEGEPTASSPQDVAASFPTAADDPQQLTQEIHETREQLGETVEALAGKADATALAEDKTSQLSGRLRSGASQASQQAAAKAGLLRSQLAGRMSGPLQNAQSAAGTARDQVRKITPDQLPEAARKTAAAAWRRRAPLAVTVGVIVLACLAVIGRRRR